MRREKLFYPFPDKHDDLRDKLYLLLFHLIADYSIETFSIVGSYGGLYVDSYGGGDWLNDRYFASTRSMTEHKVSKKRNQVYPRSVGPLFEIKFEL